MNKCQFYIVLGNANYMSKDNSRVCINIKDNELTNYSEIRNNLINLYSEKAKEGFNVNNEIIFLITDERYRNIALKIMNQIGLNGRVLVINRENNAINNTFKPNNEVISPKEKNTNETITNKMPEQPINEESKPVEKPKFSYRPDTQIFHKEELYGSDGGTPKTNSGMTNNKANVLSLKPKKNKRAAFVSLPVLIFIFSTLLLIASFVLLFILD